MQTQCNVLGFMINLYLHDCKLVIKIDEKIYNGHSNRNIDYKIRRQKIKRTKSWL